MTLKSFLRTLRRVILDSVKIYDDRIEFDRSRAESNNHDKYDIDVAELMFSKDGYFTDKFTKEIELLFAGGRFNREPEFCPIQFYVPFVRIIFIINAKEQISTRIFEDDLVKHIAAREAINKYVGSSDNELGKQQPKIAFKW